MDSTSTSVGSVVNVDAQPEIVGVLVVTIMEQGFDSPMHESDKEAPANKVLTLRYLRQPKRCQLSIAANGSEAVWAAIHAWKAGMKGGTILTCPCRARMAVVVTRTGMNELEFWPENGNTAKTAVISS